MKHFSHNKSVETYYKAVHKPGIAMEIADWVYVVNCDFTKIL